MTDCVLCSEDGFSLVPFTDRHVSSTVFWTRLSSKYGTTFYVRDNGVDLAVTNAIDAIVTCLRSEDGYCVDVPDVAPSMKSLGLF